MKRLLFGFLLLLSTFLLYSEDFVSEMVYSQILFEEGKPVVVSDEWIEVGKTDLSAFFRTPVSQSDSIRKWRVVVTYMDENRTGQTTLQVRLRGEGYTTLFTLPWSQFNSIPTEEESNWYMADRMNPQNFLSQFSARLITPPGSVQPGKIYKIVLESWEFKPVKENKTYSYNDTLLASSSILQPIGTKQNHNVTVNTLEADDPYSRVKAEEFALNFVESSLYGDLPAFYRSLDNEIHSLSDGLRHSKFIINPPEGVNAAWSMTD
jgi:hypothetical protein